MSHHAAHENEKVDSATGQTIRTHEWDGITELNTPLPRWWINIFYACILWSVGYWIVYPSWPLLTDYARGVTGYASRLDVQAELDAIKAVRAKQAAGLEKASLDEIAKNPDLRRVALAAGKAAFGDNCAPCHGGGGAGAVGYPNLNDDDWLWGGKLADIHQTLENGVRAVGNDKTRIGMMAAFGRDGVLKPDEVRLVANHVRALAKLPTEKSYDEAKASKIFAENCAACHGDAGKGSQEFGAPNLTDGIWLYGNSIETIVETVTNGRQGLMPAWGARLDPVTLKALTVYVHSLGGGK
jgi:cytochrome c oxidase cbb3-type subunit III